MGRAYSPLATLNQERLKADEEQAWAIQKAQLQQIADDLKDRERRMRQQAEIEQQEREPPKVADKPPFPKVEIDATEFDFGEIPVGKTVTHRFTIKNVGQGPLIIQRVVPDSHCGVGRVSMPRPQIPPGGTASVEITFTPRDLTRCFAKSNHVSTNDPSRPEFDVKVHAQVIAAAVTPGS